MTIDDLSTLTRQLSIARRWTARSSELNCALSTSTTSIDRAPTYDPRLEGWLERSRDICRSAATQMAKKLAPDHPAKLSFGLLGDLSTASLHETVHTQLLAWFLCPAKSHGLGDRLLRAMIEETDGFERADYDSMQVDQVTPEYSVDKGRVDIFAEGTVGTPTRHWSLWVESKTKGTTPERRNQLADYERARSAWRNKHATDGIDLGIFLTPDGRDATSAVRPENWLCMTYGRLAAVLWKAATSVSNGEPSPGLDLLRFYLASVFHDLAHWPTPIEPHIDHFILEELEDVL